MMNTPLPAQVSCHCDRREFLKTTAFGTAAALSASTGVHALATQSKLAGAIANQSGQPETLVAQLYQSLKPQQREQVCFPFDHPLRSKVDNNWDITDTYVEDLQPDQRAMVREIFIKIHSREYVDKVLHQVTHDAGGDGFDGSCSIALFGEPGTGKFEFVLTGRHVTRRCDGDSVEGTAFGGPIFYGHAAESAREKAHHPGNVYWYQALRANEVYQMLDGKQRDHALLKKGRAERGTKTVELTGKKEGLPGIPVAALSGDQKDHVRKVIADVLAPYRPRDVEESLNLIEAAGFDHLHLAFFKAGDIGNDQVWDVWQVEGPAMLMYFRGSPHVHAWIHIKDPATV